MQFFSNALPKIPVLLLNLPVVENLVPKLHHSGSLAQHHSGTLHIHINTTLTAGEYLLNHFLNFALSLTAAGNRSSSS